MSAPAVRRGDRLFGSDRRIDASRVFPTLRVLLDPVLERLRLAGGPSDVALRTADRLLDVVRNAGLDPDRATADAGGGVCLSFFAQPLDRRRFVQLGCDDDGTTRSTVMRTAPSWPLAQT